MVNSDIIQLTPIYDREVDALTLKVNGEYDYHVSLEVNPHLIIDVSTDERILAFEILYAEHYFEASAEELSRADFIVTVTVNEDVIKFDFILLIPMDNQTLKAFHTSSKTVNEAYVGEGIFKYATSGVIE